MAEVRNESDSGANLRMGRRAFWPGDCQVPPPSPWIPDRVGNDDGGLGMTGKEADRRWLRVVFMD